MLAGTTARATAVAGLILMLAGLSVAASRPPARPAAGAGDKDKLPAAVASRIKSIEQSLTNAESRIRDLSGPGADTRLAGAQKAVDTGRETLEDALKRYPQTPADHPDIQAIRKKLDDFSAKVKDAQGQYDAAKKGAADKKAGAQALSDEWVARLSPYAANNPGQKGYDKDKRFIAGATDDTEEMQRRLKVYGELAPLFADYKKVPFPDGKSSELEQIERTLDYGLKSFEESFQSRTTQRLAAVDRQLDQAARFLKEQKARIGTKEKPLPLEKDTLPTLIKSIDAIAAVAPKDDPKLAAAREKLASVQSLAAEIRAASIDQTVMHPEKYAGQDLPALKAKAEQVVLAKFADAKALRTCIISSDWKEEQVLEPTDTTNTALRLRTTRSVTAQVAAKRGDQVHLHTLDISKDRRSDGTWGELKGHIMFTDQMLEKNVNAGQ